MLDVLIRAGSFVAIILLGYLLRKVGVFRKEDFKVLSTIVLKITLPAAVIVSIANTEITPSMLILTLLGFGGGVLYMVAGYLMNLRGTREQKAFSVLNTSGYNIGCFSLPFVQSFLGSAGVAATSLFDTGNAFVVLGGSYGVASTIKAGNGFSGKRLAKALLTSVPFLAYLLMATLKLCRVPIPSQVVAFVQPVANANAFLAMLMIGVGFELKAEKKNLKVLLKIVITRYAIATALALVFYNFLPFSQEIRSTLVILAFSPLGASTPIFTSQLKEDVGLSSAINSVCILISIILNVVLLMVLL
ncbi:MAG: AEC family transporter [Oscillospiraceae bacterium]|nr:AEC family transporter [Oscillospiraceae bacterium]